MRFQKGWYEFMCQVGNQNEQNQDACANVSAEELLDNLAREKMVTQRAEAQRQFLVQLQGVKSSAMIY